MKILVEGTGSHLLAWAKKQHKTLEALREDLGLPAMQKHWQIGESFVSVRSSEHGDFIRITGGLRYYALVAMPDPTPYRSLFLSTVDNFIIGYDYATANSQAIANAAANSNLENTAFNSNFGPVATRALAWVILVFPAASGNLTAVATGYSHHYSSGVQDPAGPFSTANGLGVAPPIYSSGASLQVTMSDGEVLATVPQDEVFPVLPANQIPKLSPEFATNWSGGDFCDLYRWTATDTGSMVLTTFAGKIQFITPSDAISPTTNFVPLVNSNVPEEQARLQADWNAGRVVAIAREKLRLQTNSENAIEMLRAGTMPSTAQSGWADFIKNSALDSNRPRVTVPFTAAFVNAPDGAFSVPGVLYTRTASITYGDVTYELAGTVLLEQTIHVHPDDRAFASTTYTFTDFPNFTSTGTPLFKAGEIYTTQHIIGGHLPGEFGESSQFFPSWPQSFIKDGNFSPLGCVLNGTWTVGHNVHATFGTPTSPTIYAGLVPPFPNTGDDTVETTAEPYLLYRDVVPPVDVNTLPDPKPAYSSNWLSTSMVDGEVVTLVPFGPVKDDEDLGMFGSKLFSQLLIAYGKNIFTPAAETQIDTPTVTVSGTGSYQITNYTNFVEISFSGPVVVDSVWTVSVNGLSLSYTVTAADVALGQPAALDSVLRRLSTSLLTATTSAHGWLSTTRSSSKLAVYGKAKFRYNLDGSFTFLSWKDGTPATDTTPAGPVILDMYDDIGPLLDVVLNCLVEYTEFPWDDVKVTAKAQTDALKAPLSVVLRFIKTVKDAV